MCTFVWGEKKNRMNKILQEDFNLTPCMVAGYEGFMDGLLNIVHSGVQNRGYSL